MMREFWTILPHVLLSYYTEDSWLFRPTYYINLTQKRHLPTGTDQNLT